MSPILQWRRGSGDEMEATVAVDPRIQARRDQVVSERIRRRRQRSVVVGALVAVVALAWAVTHSSLLAVHRLVITGSPHVVGRRGGPDLGYPRRPAPHRRRRAQRLGPASCASPGWPRPGSAWAGTGWRIWPSPNATRSLAVVDGPSRWVLADAGRRALAVVDAVPAGVVAVSGVAPVPPGATFGSALDAPLAVVAHLSPGLRTRVGAGGVAVAADGSLTMSLAAQWHRAVLPAGRSGHQAERVDHVLRPGRRPRPGRRESLHPRRHHPDPDAGARDRRPRRPSRRPALPARWC